MDYLKLGAAGFEELRGAAARVSRLAERRRASERMELGEY